MVLQKHKSFCRQSRCPAMPALQWLWRCCCSGCGGVTAALRCAAGGHRHRRAAATPAMPGRPPPRAAPIAADGSTSDAALSASEAPKPEFPQPVPGDGAGLLSAREDTFVPNAFP